MTRPWAVHNVTAGVSYALTEIPLPNAGYTPPVCGAAPPARSTPPTTRSPWRSAAEVTCTIVNTDDTPTLNLVKTVTNDDGGTTMATDYDLTATGASGGAARDCPDIG